MTYTIKFENGVFYVKEGNQDTGKVVFASTDASEAAGKREELAATHA